MTNWPRTTKTEATEQRIPADFCNAIVLESSKMTKINDNPLPTAIDADDVPFIKPCRLIIKIPATKLRVKMTMEMAEIITNRIKKKS